VTDTFLSFRLARGTGRVLFRVAVGYTPQSEQSVVGTDVYQFPAEPTILNIRSASTAYILLVLNTVLVSGGR
jgi:hypothetical protein